VEKGEQRRVHSPILGGWRDGRGPAVRKIEQMVIGEYWLSLLMSLIALILFLPGESLKMSFLSRVLFDSRF
jgi:hypothetical protein